MARVVHHGQSGTPTAKIVHKSTALVLHRSIAAVVYRNKIKVTQEYMYIVKCTVYRKLVQEKHILWMARSVYRDGL
jgi:hypothetical protein